MKGKSVEWYENWVGMYT